MKKLAFYIVFFTLINAGFSQSDAVANDVKVFPNPATTVINVLGLKNDQHAAISIIDSYGNQVIFHQWTIKNNALNIPILNLEKGMYLLRIRSEHQNVQTKFYKQ